VLNGGAASGSAATATETLASFGFLTVAPASTETSAATSIQYPAGQEGAAKAVAAYLPGAAVAASTTVSQVTVVLGSDGLMPAAPVAAEPAAPAPEATPAGTTYAAGACIN
jgi:hypothetical protein